MISLSELIPPGGLDLLPFLRTAVALAELLAENHRRGKILLALTPELVRVDRFTGEATLLSATPDAALDPRYASPEASGRLARPADQRSDLYTLGIILYELLTGTVPFVSDEPLDLFHSHLTSLPDPPAALRGTLPPPLSAIVMKLLAKDPADRYQSAVGLRHDLELCLRQFERTGTIAGIVIGSADHRGTLHFPSRLYGRDQELAALTGSFRRVARGAREMVLVSGPPGIGKSSLVHEVRQPVLNRQGWFIAGKFDQSRLTIPYSALADAVTQLVRRLLGERAVRLDEWRSALVSQVGPNLRIIADIIPDIERITGELPPVQALPPAEGENRLLFTFSALVRTITSARHPLVVFLDDLQWLDLASLRLLRHLACDQTLSHLLLIGAFRDHEVPPSHPLIPTLDEISRSGVLLNRIVLMPLEQNDVRQFLAETLNCGDETWPLADLVHQKTDGNPFFVRQFLQTLHHRNLLSYDAGAGWVWDLQTIRAEGLTDNVVDLLVARISALPQESVALLKGAACLGGSFAADTLGLVMGVAPETLPRTLAAAVEERIIVGEPASPVSRYYFLHDRIRQAVYALLTDEERAALHLKIGRGLLANDPGIGRLFETVNHLNAGAVLMAAPEERQELARLNLEAGRLARNAAAHGSAREYFAAGVAQLGNDCWNPLYELAFPLHLVWAESASLTADFSEAKRLYELTLKHARSALDKAEVYQGLLALHEMTGDAPEAIRCGMKGLAAVGHPFGTLPVKLLFVRKLLAIRLRLLRSDFAEIEHLPKVTDQEIIAAQNLLMLMIPPAYFFDKDLVVTLALHMVELSLRYGNAPSSPYAYVTFSVVMGSVLGRYDMGARWGSLALALCGNDEGGLLAARTRFIYGGYVNHWTHSVRTSVPLLRGAFRQSLEAGDIRNAIHIGFVLSALSLQCGEPLDKVQEEAARHAALCREAGGREQEGMHRALQQLVLNLKGETDGPDTFSSEGYDEQSELREMRNVDVSLSLTVFLYLKVCSLYLFGFHEQAYRLALEAEEGIMDKEFGNMNEADFCYFATLAAIAAHPALNGLERVRCRLKIRANRKKLRIWSRFCPENFRHKLLLVEAELCRFGLSTVPAVPLYEQAITEAREQGFAQYEALGNELAGRYCLKSGDMHRGAIFLRESRAQYGQWGAIGKVRALEQEYPFLAGPAPAVSSLPPVLSPGRGGVVDPDMASVVRASQAISGASDLERLLKTLLRIAIQHAGAQRGVVIMETSGALRVVAEGSSDSQEIVVNEGVAREAAGAFPCAMVNLSVRTGEVIIVNDPAEPCEFADDPYLAHSRPLSMMCLPLVHQGRRASAIYLENRLLPHAFTAKRIAVLNILAHQIAVSLENALLNREKEDILRYLHDSISSDLVAIRFAGEVPNPRAERDELAAKLDVVTDIARNSIETVRTFMNLAAGDTLSLREFIGMLRDCAYRILEDTADFELAEQGGGEMNLSPLTAFNLHLVFKEALTNIRKHAAADHVDLTVDTSGEGLVISLCDNGRGFDVHERRSGGHGVGNMAARAEKLGADFTVSSEPGGGTQILLRLPTQ